MENIDHSHNNFLEAALSIAASALAGRTLDGEALILSSLQVGLLGSTDEERAAGFLLYTLDDTSLAPADLLTTGIPEGVVAATELLRHRADETLVDRARRVAGSSNPIALATLCHELTILTNKDRADRLLTEALAFASTTWEKLNRVRRYEQSRDSEEETRVAVFAAGCFWGVQHYFEKAPGVVRTLVGYTGGSEEMPTYNAVRAHRTGHVEAILVEYDAKATSYEELAKLFFEIHDPAQTDGQGPDKGEQYRSAAFYTCDEQRQVLTHLIGWLRERGHEVHTIVKPLTTFWTAEEWHQHYYNNTGGSPYCHFRIRKF